MRRRVAHQGDAETAVQACIKFSRSSSAIGDCDADADAVRGRVAHQRDTRTAVQACKRFHFGFISVVCGA